MSRYKYRSGFAPSELRKENSSSFRLVSAGRSPDGLVQNQTTITYLGLKDKVGFGKHRTRTWEEVIFEDPDYVQWAFDSIPNFYLDEEATKVWRNRMLAKEADEEEQS